MLMRGDAKIMARFSKPSGKLGPNILGTVSFYMFEHCKVTIEIFYSVGGPRGGSRRSCNEETGNRGSGDAHGKSLFDGDGGKSRRYHSASFMCVNSRSNGANTT